VFHLFQNSVIKERLMREKEKPALEEFGHLFSSFFSTPPCFYNPKSLNL
jgi:hypothetical protein